MLLLSLLGIIRIANAVPTSLADKADLDPYSPGNQTCNDASYNPDEARNRFRPFQYICQNGILCPVINGEPLSLCGRACFSQYIYTCTGGTDLHLRHHQAQSRVTLRAVSPQNRAIDKLPMTACNLSWTLGNKTCSYCPEQVPGIECPAGNVTVIDTSSGRNSMGVLVPGGQMFYLTEDWTVGYTQAHSASFPRGATLDGFVAFEGGGFFNLLDGARGWAACGRGPRFELKVRNATNGGELTGCVGLNLVMEGYDDAYGAWQYS